jgi:hypothetical protein
VVRLHGTEPRKTMQEHLCGVAPGVRRALADAMWACRGEELYWHMYVGVIAAMVAAKCVVGDGVFVFIVL